jgi:DNA-binding Xre family transcriptional regulator
MVFLQIVKELRKIMAENNITQAELGRRAEMHRAQVNLIFTGKKHDMCISTLERLAESLGKKIVIKFE